MSVVGPRPLLTKYLPLYNEKQRRRHEVRPGMSGYAQTHGRNTASWEERFDMDVYYVDHITFLGDVKIIIDTVLSVVKREGIDSNETSTVTMEEFKGTGIVLIDELETHLHIELQKKILPFLTEFFPRLQFIVTTHSPYILNSIPNARAYDLEKHIELENLSVYSSEDLAEAYFDTDEYSEVLKEKLEKYKELVGREDLSNDERALRAELRFELSNISKELSADMKI